MNSKVDYLVHSSVPIITSVSPLALEKFLNIFYRIDNSEFSDTIVKIAENLPNAIDSSELLWAEEISIKDVLKEMLRETRQDEAEAFAEKMESIVSDIKKSDNEAILKNMLEPSSN
ncbi:MAG: hypothetical protein N4A44_00905 [Alphaproteobacteria bacterium]|jgi:hypothetical protein|nr:hypothetical protein [Alphaproteobacteria bacterium]